MPTALARYTHNESNSSVRILLIEDHVILREGLRSLLETEPGLAIIGEAGSGEEGIKFAEAAMPDLIMTDIGLPGRSGLSIIPDLQKAAPAAAIIVLTAHCTDEYVRAALDAGANGYILKDAERQELMDGIRATLDGNQYLSKTVAEKVVSGYLRDPSPDRKRKSAEITNRERQVLLLIAAANSNKKIAAKLDVSIKTVEKHRSNLMRKLNLRSTAEITLYAVRNNMITPYGEAFHSDVNG